MVLYTCSLQSTQLFNDIYAFVDKIIKPNGIRFILDMRINSEKHIDFRTGSSSEILKNNNCKYLYFGNNPVKYNEKMQVIKGGKVIETMEEHEILENNDCVSAVKSIAISCKKFDKCLLLGSKPNKFKDNRSLVAYLAKDFVKKEYGETLYIMHIGER